MNAPLPDLKQASYAPLPAGPFSTIYADPPWRFATRSAKGLLGRPQHYGRMTQDELLDLPVGEIAAKDSALFLWTTFPHLEFALAVIRAWGFDYRTGGSWAKRTKTGRAWMFGLGYVFRGASELLLVGVKGNPTWTSKSIRNLWTDPVREHSRKPDSVRADIERLTVGPRVELFARESVPGWTSWGLETTKFDG